MSGGPDAPHGWQPLDVPAPALPADEAPQWQPAGHAAPAPTAPSASWQGLDGRPAGPYPGQPDPFLAAPVVPAWSEQQRAAYAAGGYVPPPVHHGPLATWWPRVGAYLIDALIQSGPFALVYGVFVALAVGSGGGEPPAPLAIGVIGLMLLGYAWILGWWIFDRVIRQARTGRSVGKRVLGLRLVREDGMPLTAGLTLGREFAHLLDAYSMYIGYLWPLWDARRQTFADKVCRTVVVRD